MINEFQEQLNMLQRLDPNPVTPSRMMRLMRLQQLANQRREQEKESISKSQIDIT